MAGPARSKAVPTDRALQFSDLDRPGRAALQGVMRDQGAVRSRLDARVDQLGRAATNPSNNATTQVKSAKNAGKLSEIAPHVVDKPVTLQGAASRRVSHFVAGIERSAAEGVSSGGAVWQAPHSCPVWRLKNAVAAAGGELSSAVAARPRAASRMGPALTEALPRRRACGSARPGRA